MPAVDRKIIVSAQFSFASLLKEHFMPWLFRMLIAICFYASFLSFSSAQSWNAFKEAAVDRLVLNYLLPASPSIGLGVDVNGSPVMRRNEGAVYHIGSVTKQFTAAALLSLIEAGKPAPRTNAPIQLNTPLTDFFTDVGAWSAPGYSGLTLRHLLTMTSNLPSFTNPNAPPPGVPLGTLIPQQPVAWSQLLAGIKGYRRAGSPAAFAYSNTNYFLLAQVIHIVSGPDTNTPGDFHQYLRSRFFNPVGMSSTGFVAEGPSSLTLAPPNFTRVASFHQPDWPKGAGDIRSNVTDMQRWLNALIGHQVLNASSTRTLFAPAVAVPQKPGWHYAMGWFCKSDGNYDRCVHDGAIAGYSSINGFRRHRTSGNYATVTILANRDGVGNLDTVADQILTMAFQ